jgi:hypothetical protein
MTQDRFEVQNGCRDRARIKEMCLVQEQMARRARYLCIDWANALSPFVCGESDNESYQG